MPKNHEEQLVEPDQKGWGVGWKEEFGTRYLQDPGTQGWAQLGTGSGSRVSSPVEQEGQVDGEVGSYQVGWDPGGWSCGGSTTASAAATA